MLDSGLSGASGGTGIRLEALIDRLAAQREQVARVAEVLGVAHEQRAARAHHAVDALEHRALRGGVEVDHHVAAEHHVEGVAQRQLVNQVHRLEAHVLLQLGLDAHLARVGALAAQEKALQPLGREALAAVGLVDAALRGGQHLGVDVAVDDLVAAVGAQRLGAGHGDGVGLFAGGSGRAPDAPVVRRLRAQQLRQRVEVVRLTEEGREVGGERVDELLPLGPVVAFQPVDVALEARVPGLAQPARDAAVHHRVLAVVQADARLLVDQCLDAREVRVGPDELAALGDGAVLGRDERRGGTGKHRGTGFAGPQVLPPWGGGAQRRGGVHVQCLERRTRADVSRISATLPSPRMVAPDTLGTLR